MKKVPFYRIFPSLITLLSLCLGMTSIRYALDEKFEMAITMVMTAAFLDGIDGSAARLLKSSSNLGAQLDSLADLVNFGVAPAFLIYFWQMQSLGGLGWAIVLIYTSCTALRLARYNAEVHDVTNQYFQGISSPCGALLVLAPLISTFELVPEDSYGITELSLYIIFIALMMVSRIPTLSSKAFKIERTQVTFVIALASLLLTSIFLLPWTIIPIIALLYLGSIPFSWFYYRGRKSSVSPLH
jgi:CDP-diacylglycerol--serine O-phosphatidyltransferase